MIQGAAGLGVDNSAVREIAQASAKNKETELSETVVTQRRLVLLTGLLGWVVTLILANYISLITFDSEEYTWHVRLLSLAVFFNLVKGGQMALVQGVRRIKDLALISILGALLSTIISIPLIYWYERDGIAAYLLLLAFGQLLISAWYSRKVKLLPIQFSWKLSLIKSRGMIRLGLAFMGGSLVTMLTAYLIKILIIRTLNLEAVGIYQAAYVISGLYINTILSAMGKDFYPRLAAANDSKEEIRIINEQTEIGMLMAAPGLLFTLALSPIIIPLLYSDLFTAAIPILQWIIMGVFLRTLSWPLGYLFIARAKSKLFFFSELLSNTIHLGLAYILMKTYGLIGLGLAFCLLYVFYSVYVRLVAARINQFRWSPEVIKMVIVLGIVFFFSFLLLSVVYLPLAMGAVLLAGFGMSYFTLLKFMKILGVNTLAGLFALLKIKINLNKKPE